MYKWSIIELIPKRFSTWAGVVIKFTAPEEKIVRIWFCNCLSESDINEAMKAAQTMLEFIPERIFHGGERAHDRYGIVDGGYCLTLTLERFQR